MGQSQHSGGRVTGPRRLCFRLPPARCARHVGPQRRRGRKDGAMVAEPKVRVAWPPRGNPAQMRLLKCQVFEIFFGGARGGGKTDGVLGEFGAHASRYGKDAIGLMVRRTRAELVETIERSREIYGPLGWKLNETEKMWRAPDGARLRFAYLERDGRPRPREGAGRALRSPAFAQRREAMERLAQGAAQAELARSYGVSQSTISRLAAPGPFEASAVGA